MKRVGQIYRESLVNRVKSGVNANKNIFLLNYSKLSGAQMNTLRKNLKKAGANVYVSKNNITRLAFKELQQEKFIENLSGQTMIVLGNSDSVEVSKALIKFMKECEFVTVYGGLLEGRMIAKDDVKKLSELPSREVLLATLFGTLSAPISRFAGALNAKSRDLLSILKQLSERK